MDGPLWARARWTAISALTQIKESNGKKENRRQERKKKKRKSIIFAARCLRKAKHRALVLDHPVSYCIPPRDLNLNLDRISAIAGKREGKKTPLYPGMFPRITKVVR